MPSRPSTLLAGSLPLWRTFVWCLCLVFHYLPSVSAAFSNVIIDDQDGDEMTGLKPVYQPANQWSFGPSCSDCLLKPDASQAYDGSWHDTTVFTSDSSFSITLKFTGPTISVFCIVPNAASPGTENYVNVTFALDGASSGSYHHSPSSSTDMQYNVNVFSKSDLSNSEHTLVISPLEHSVFLFDYALYTFGQDDPISTPLETSTVLVSGSTTTSTTVSIIEVTSTASPVTVSSSTSPTFTSVSGSAIGGVDSSSQSSSSSFDRGIATFSSLSSLASPSSLSGAAILSTRSSGSSIATQSIPQGGSSTNNTSSSSSPRSGLHIPLAAIIGVGVGGFVVVILLVSLCIWGRRRARNKNLGGDGGEEKFGDLLPSYAAVVPQTPSSAIGQSPVISMYNSSSHGLLDRASVPASASGHSLQSYSTYAADPDERSPIYDPSSYPLRVVNRPTERLTPVRRPTQSTAADLATLATGIESINTDEEIAMRERVDTLQTQVERMVMPKVKGECWEDLPPAYEGQSRRVLPTPPGQSPRKRG